MNIGPNFYDSLKGIDLSTIQKLEKGPKGFQNEVGFEIVEGLEAEGPAQAGEDDGEQKVEKVTLPTVVVVPLYAVLCKSAREPVPQYRYLSPYELARQRAEIRDRVVAVRIDVADQDLSELVVGGRDDVVEEMADNGVQFAGNAIGSIGGKLVRALTGLTGVAQLRVASLGERLAALLRGLGG